LNKKSPLSAFLTAILVAGLVLVGAMGFGTAQASTDVNGVPDFTLRYVDNSYDVPPKTTTSTDPYTNEITTTTIPGYHVENKTVEAVIKNNIGASHYNFRYKGARALMLGNGVIIHQTLTLSADITIMILIPFPIRLRLQAIL
jgi:hypothetical protein